MWHMHFLRKQVIQQMSYVNRNDMVMEKKVWFHPININCYISTSLDFVIPRAKSSEKNQKQPCRGVCFIFSEHLS